MIVLSEKQPRRLIRSYFAYYQGSRTQLGLEKDCPFPGPIELPDQGPISEEQQVGGLHPRYFRQEA